MQGAGAGIPVIDLFAGPGGLGEGFSALRWPLPSPGGRGQGEGASALAGFRANGQHDSRKPGTRNPARTARRAFRIALSIEKDPAAHATLELRSFFRQFADGEAPEAYYEHLRGEITREELFCRHPEEAERAQNEAWCAELGRTPAALVRRRIRKALNGARAWVLIGGPPGITVRR